MSNTKVIKPIPYQELAGKYGVDRHGNLYKKRTKIINHVRVTQWNPKKTDTYCAASGARMSIMFEGKFYRYSVGRIVLDTFLPSPSDQKYFAWHLDRDRLNNALDNLAWKTTKEMRALRTPTTRDTDSTSHC